MRSLIGLQRKRKLSDLVFQQPKPLLHRVIKCDPTCATYQLHPTLTPETTRYSNSSYGLVKYYEVDLRVIRDKSFDGKLNI